MDIVLIELLLAYGGDLDAVFAYLTELLGSQAAAQSVITEDVVI